MLVHGGRYLYSKTIYVNSKTRILVTCVLHGDFRQRADSHLLGAGCQRCAIELSAQMQKMPLYEFELRAHAKHEHKYNYSLVDYQNYSSDIVVICPQHGEFDTTVQAHLSGSGCISCKIIYGSPLKGRARYTTEQFILRAGAVHPGKYTYPDTVYSDSRSTVKITCPVHGNFDQVASEHLIGHGCPDCAGHPQYDTAKWIRKAKLVHGESKYSYDEAIFISDELKIKICCLEHGPFLQRPSGHIAGIGCRQCALDKLHTDNLLQSEEFLAQCYEMHRFRYDYSKVAYTGVRNEIAIICRLHGVFRQIAHNHINGAGCSLCTRYSSIVENAWLNLLGLPDTTSCRQVLLHGNGKRFRVDGFNPLTNSVFEFDGDFWHGNPRFFDPSSLNTVCDETFGELYAKTLNKRSMLEALGYHVISIWESDFCADVVSNLTKFESVLDPVSLVRIRLNHKEYERMQLQAA